MRELSPLRYPGGKGALLPEVRAIMYANRLQGGTYIEPFAGGAAVAIGLLLGEHVDEIVINDFDSRVNAFWKAVVDQNKLLKRKISETPLTMEEWERQRAIYLKPGRHSRLAVGFAAFYLNRCNRSGIMVNGGPIGGKSQAGVWKLDARFNREGLCSRIDRISERREQIKVSGFDCLDLLDQVEEEYRGKRVLVYLDPPYFKHGPRLYFSSFDKAAHEALAERMKRFSLPWVMTYDHVPEIKKFYRWARVRPFGLSYSSYERREGREILIWPEHVNVPNWSQRVAKAS